jgi:hypothetical protein
LHSQGKCHQQTNGLRKDATCRKFNKSVSKHICVLRKLKYKLNRQDISYLLDQSPSSCRS